MIGFNIGVNLQGGVKMSKKVLIVDDDPDVRMFNATVVEESGYTPIEAPNGEEGLTRVKKEKPDLVLLDVLMPKQSGIRLYRELKTDKALIGHSRDHAFRGGQAHLFAFPEGAYGIRGQAGTRTGKLSGKAG
jgi:CheY-like chemotaxis protein